MMLQVSQQSQHSEKQQSRTPKSKNCAEKKAAPNPITVALNGQIDPAEQCRNAAQRKTNTDNPRSCL
jgi:hypothetical protein